MPRKKDSKTVSFTYKGKRHYASGKNDKEAAVNADRMLTKLKNDEIITGGNTLVRVWAEYIIGVYKTDIKEVTRKKYVSRMNHCVLEYIGDMQLDGVTEADCQNVINHQKGMSKRQISEVSQMMNFIFDTAKANHHILVNPARNIRRPKGTEGHYRTITADERHHFLKVCENNDRFIFFLVMYYCGLRPSEVMELKGKDVQTLTNKKKTITILDIRGTKSDNAPRQVPLPKILYDKIKDTASEEYVCKTMAGNKHNDSSYRRLTNSLYRAMNISMGAKLYRNQFVDENNKPIDDDKLPLSDDFVPYDLRHTYCTDLQENGIDMRVAQKYMGHSDIALTANIYTDPTEEMLFSGYEKLSD